MNQFIFKYKLISIFTLRKEGFKRYINLVSGMAIVRRKRKIPNSDKKHISAIQGWRCYKYIHF